MPAAGAHAERRTLTCTTVSVNPNQTLRSEVERSRGWDGILGSKKEVPALCKRLSLYLGHENV